jgi:hypothetical protein
MPDRIALIAVAAAVCVAVCVAGCAQPGTPVPLPQAQKLVVGTSDIATACGYAEEATAFGDHHVTLAPLDAMARMGAVKVAHVYDEDQTDIYQGESVGGVVNDSISLLGECGLPAARAPLRQALAAHK